MSKKSIIDQAVDIVKDAVMADNAQEYEKAFTLYKRSIEYFMTGLKYEKNPKTREIVLNKVSGYMERAEVLKKELTAAANPAPKKAAAAAGDGKGGDEEDKDNGENAKMKGALANAIVSEKPNIKWSDVAGLEGAKEALKEAVILPVKFPQLFEGKRRPWKGILLYGPPGTGKSYLAKAVATEANSTFFSVSSSDLVSKWQGESERLVKNLFEMAREQKPSIIFIDEIDSLCSNRSEGESDSARRIKTEFLVQMQGVGKTHDGILVLGATNIPWELDPAMRRRFEKRVYISLPEKDARAYMFKLHLGDTPNTVTDEEFALLGQKAEGYSGSDISVCVREALMEPLRKCQHAKFFVPCSEAGKLMPWTESYPPCTSCPIDIQAMSNPKTFPACQKCGAIRTTLMEVPQEALKVPKVDVNDFLHVLNRGGGATVNQKELTEFEDWTKEFGQEG